MKGDLHFHSSYSDGGHSVEYLTERALRLGLQAVSLTDHDTFRGSKEFAEAAKRAGLTAISGIELSTYGVAEIHILGYGVDYEADNALTAMLTELNRARQQRVERILDKLRGVGIDISLEEVSASGTYSVGRKHIAEVMARRRFVKDIGTAFEQYLGEGKPCYVKNTIFTPEEAVRTVKQSGGLAVWAHPGRVRLPRPAFEKMLEKLVNAGLAGIETYYPAHSIDMAEYYLSLTNKYKLIATSGSDFHNEGDSGLNDYNLRTDTVKALIG